MVLGASVGKLFETWKISEAAVISIIYMWATVFLILNNIKSIYVFWVNIYNDGIEMGF
jgi:hypothetical protein